MSETRFKFRVWTGYEGKMIYPDIRPAKNLVSYEVTSLDFIMSLSGILLLMHEKNSNPVARFCGEYGVAGAGISFTNPEIMQWTGLTDSSGKDIYEGDILSWSDYQGWEDGRTFNGMYEVIWNIDDAKFELQDVHSGDKWEIGDTQFDDVIGNIYENPYLVDVKTDEDEPPTTQLG